MDAISRDDAVAEPWASTPRSHQRSPLGSTVRVNLLVLVPGSSPPQTCPVGRLDCNHPEPKHTTNVSAAAPGRTFEVPCRNVSVNIVLAVRANYPVPPVQGVNGGFRPTPDDNLAPD